MSTVNSVLECIANVVDVTNVLASNAAAQDLLASCGIEASDTDSDTYELMFLYGDDRAVGDVLSCETIVVDGYRDKKHRLPPVIVGQFKSKGYKEFDFDNSNLMVFTKNKDVAAAISRRPFKFEKKDKVEPEPERFTHKYVPPTNYTHKYEPPKREDLKGDINEE